MKIIIDGIKETNCREQPIELEAGHDSVVGKNDRQAD